MVKVIVVMPAYNAAKTLEPTIKGLPSVYEKIIVCDDASRDETVRVSRSLNCVTLTHSSNRGYGANQKTLYNEALKYNPDIVIMVHPDNQYETSRLADMIDLILDKKMNLVLGVRTKTALKNHMPLWKFMSNRGLTRIQNLVFKRSLLEYHTGLRVYDGKMIKAMPYKKFSNNFCFDSEVLAWVIANGYRISEVDAQCFYTSESSSIKFFPSVKYGLDTLRILKRFRNGYYTNLADYKNKTGKKLIPADEQNSLES